MSLRRYVHTIAVILSVVLISPAMSASILHLVNIGFTQHVLLEYISSIADGFVASKIAIGENKNALLPALLALIYVLTMPA